MKHTLAKIFIYMAGQFLFTGAYAADATNLSTLLDAVHAMKADFKQTVYDNHHKAIQVSFGRMMMQRPGKFRWEVLKPMPQIIIANQTKLWIYDPDLEQVSIRSLQKAAGETPALLLSNVNSTLNTEYTVTTMTKNNPGWQWYQLVPRKTDNMFAAIQMGFMGNQIHEMDLKDQLGHTTKIEYKNIQTNMALDNSLFNFKPPAHVDVIDETKKT